MSTTARKRCRPLWPRQLPSSQIINPPRHFMFCLILGNIKAWNTTVNSWVAKFMQFLQKYVVILFLWLAWSNLFDKFLCFFKARDAETFLGNSGNLTIAAMKSLSSVTIWSYVIFVIVTSSFGGNVIFYKRLYNR